MVNKGNTAFVGEFDLPKAWINDLTPVHPKKTELPIGSGENHSNHIGGLLDHQDIHTLHDYLNTQHWIPVGVNGMKSSYTPGDQIGSWRASCYEEAFAHILYNRLRQILPNIWTFDGTTTQNHPHPRWKFTGVNPLLRFIKYEQGGVLVPHYDWAFDYPDGKRRTLASLVLYISGVPGTGRTRFLKDPQASQQVTQRDTSDWTRAPRKDEIAYIHKATPGDGLIFDHAILHDGEPHQGHIPKIIMRTDLVFEPEV